MINRIRARQAEAVSPPHIERDAAIVSSFLSDAAHVPGGFAAGVAFPRTEGEVAALIRHARRVLPVGAQSSLTGGATPRGELILSTRALTIVGNATGDSIRVGAGVPLGALQRMLAAKDRYYPPVPTYDGAFVGGAIATNAAGAATFKHGSTRPWVQAIAVVLANGDVLEITRGECRALGRHFDIQFTSGDIAHVPVPGYSMPDVPKLSAGYYSSSDMDLIDLFIGSEGTLGVVTEATLKLVRRPRRLVALVECAGDTQAVALTTALRREAEAAWAGRGPLDMAAIEYIDALALHVVPAEAYTRAGVPAPGRQSAMLLIQIETEGGAGVVERLHAVLAEHDISADPHVALPGDDRGAERLFALREAVPASVNSRVAEAQSRHAGVEKTAADVVVPFSRLSDSIALYRSAFEARGLDYAIWGHMSDGNLHPNLVPRSFEDVCRGREAIQEIARGVMAMGGAPLAEHGVGRSALKQQLLRELYGAEGIEAMRAVKRALDPEWKLAPGVLFPP